MSKTPYVATGFKALIVNDADGNTLAMHPGTNTEDAQANARLFAAAPELLAALAQYQQLGWQHNFGSTATHEECRKYLSGLCDWWNNIAVPAIEKALG